MAAQVEIEDQNGEVIDPVPSTADSVILLHEGNTERVVITTCFLSGMGTFSNDTTIVTITKNSSEGITTRAKILSFKLFTEAIARKNDGVSNVKYAWYAASKPEIENIISYGFTNRENAIHLTPSKYSILAAAGAEEDEEGLRHILLCRVILGKSELVVPGSKQTYPSSNEFDSGVDNLENPRKYVIWSSNMNSYILPSYIVSFKSPHLRVLRTRPSSPWVSFASLMSMLSKSIEPSRMNLIVRTYSDFRKRKIRRDELVKKMREVAGDNLLAHIIKNNGDK